MEIRAIAQGYAQGRVETRGHTIICDQPEGNGGSDQGMTPTEMLGAALAGCGLYYAAQYLKTRGLSAEGLEVHLHAEKASAPARIGRFRLEIKTPPLEEQHREPLLRAVKACVVHNTLKHAPEIEVGYAGE
jgi:uncharacterized OsmC-like protein